MTGELFELLDSTGFGENVHEVASEGNCRVLRLEDSTGEGYMTMHRVFDGVYLMYNDFHLKSCDSQYQNAGTVLCIDHCREGRIEHENKLGGRYFMEPGDLRIDTRVHHEGKVHMPLCHYHGVTIGFLRGLAEKSLQREFPSLSIDLGALAAKFCPDDKEFLLREDRTLDLLFSQLYQVPREIREDYFKVKTAELLLVLGNMEPSSLREERQYFPAAQTDRVRQIHTFLTGDLSHSYTVEELSRRFGMPPGTLRKVFRAVYGSPVYQYMKVYRMKMAAQMLLCGDKMKISDIAAEAGYENASKFSAAFRDVMGVSPQEYRRKQGN